MTRIARASSLAAVLLALAAAPASAHVSFHPDTIGGHSTLTSIVIPHDCDGKGTTSIEVQVPKELVIFTPVETAGWNIEVAAAEAAESHDHEGHDEGDSHKGHSAAGSVTWTRTGDPVPSDQAAAIPVLAAAAGGATGSVAVPMVQGCPGGEEVSWIEVAEDGESADSLEYPAPTVNLDASGDDHGHDEMSDDDHKAMSDGGDDDAAGDGADDGDSGDSVEDAQDTADSAGRLGIIAIVLGALAIVLGVVSLRRGRSKD